MAEINQIEKIRMVLDAYGVGVRAGVITPCLQDENEFRKLLGLQQAPPEVQADWTAGKGVRKPVTIQQPGGTSPGGSSTTGESDPGAQE